MSTLIYVETSIPSFYFDTRRDVEMQARRKWTRLWWGLPKTESDLVTGFPVLAELDQAPSPKREQALKLMSGLEVLPPDPEIDEIVAVYLAHKLMPTEALGDAHHLALACYHRCDMLVTWNCKHIANAEIRNIVAAVSYEHGYGAQVICTPEELMGE